MYVLSITTLYKHDSSEEKKFLSDVFLALGRTALENLDKERCLSRVFYPFKDEA